MSVARDALTKSAAFTADTDFLHTPVGAPKGVLVYIAQNGSAADEVDSVLYGGVPMTRVGFARDTVTEPMAVYAYFLGSGLAATAQSVTISETGGSTKVAWSETLTAGADTEVEAFGVAEENQANPAATLATGAGVETYVSGLLMSGAGNQGSITAGAEGTKLQNHDFGQQVAVIGERDTLATGGNVVFDWVAATDDVAMIAVAVKEAAAVSGQTLALGNVPGPASVQGVELSQSGPVALALGKVASPKAARGAGLTQSGPVSLALSKVASPKATRGVDLTLGGVAGLELGKVTSAGAIRGLGLSQSGPVTLGLGKVTAAPAPRGVGLTQSGPVSLELGKVPTPGAVRGVTLTSGSTVRLTLGRVQGPRNARGLGLTQSGPVSLELGNVTSGAAVRGVGLTQGGTATLNLGRVTTGRTVRGVSLTQAGPTALQLGRVTLAPTVRGVDLAQSGAVTLALGHVPAGHALRAPTLRLGPLVSANTVTTTDRALSAATLAETASWSLTLDDSAALYGVALEDSALAQVTLDDDIPNP